MATQPHKPTPPAVPVPPSESPRYILLPAKAMPKILPDHVVLSATPLGQRPIQKPEKDK